MSMRNPKLGLGADDVTELDALFDRIDRDKGGFLDPSEACMHAPSNQPRARRLCMRIGHLSTRAPSSPRARRLCTPHHCCNGVRARPPPPGHALTGWPSLVRWWADPSEDPSEGAGEARSEDGPK